MTQPVVNLMYDSGAYSAFTKGKPINLKEYADFLLKFQKEIKTPVNLDSINPGKPEEAAAQGYTNFQYLKDRGIKTMPVFHAREHTRWLDKMIDECDYIGLSTTSLVSPSEQDLCLKLMWDHITDEQGRAIRKFHAFGDTSPVSMRRYPWFSSDSATWQIQSGKTGAVMIDEKSYKFKSKTIGRRQYIDDGASAIDKSHLPKEDQKRKIREWGLDPDKIIADTLGPVEMTCIRCYLNASALLELQTITASNTVYKPEVQGRMVSSKKYTNGFVREGPVKFHFVVSTAVCGWALPVLAKLKIRNILLSYYYCEQKFWEREFVPYIYEPDEQCQSNKRFKKYWDLLDKYSLKEVPA